MGIQGLRIRTATPDDVEASLRLHALARPDHAMPRSSLDRAGLGKGLDTLFFAELDGVVVGSGRAARRKWLPRMLPKPETAGVNVVVVPAFRRCGIGEALWQVVLAAVPEGCVVMECVVDEDNAEGLRSAEQRGFAEVDRSAPIWRQDVTAWAERIASDNGMADVEVFELDPKDVVTLRSLHALHERVGPEAPGYEPVSFEDYAAERRTWIADGGVSIVARVGGSVVGATSAERLAFVPVAHCGFTMVDPPHGGKGIGRALKVALTVWARRNGVERLVTYVDDRNERMLAVNAGVGYRPVRSIRMSRPVPGPSERSPVDAAVERR